MWFSAFSRITFSIKLSLSAFEWQQLAGCAQLAYWGLLVVMQTRRSTLTCERTDSDSAINLLQLSSDLACRAALAAALLLCQQKLRYKVKWCHRKCDKYDACMSAKASKQWQCQRDAKIMWVSGGKKVRWPLSANHNHQVKTSVKGKIQKQITKYSHK